MEYKVRLMMDDTYEVIMLTPNEKYEDNDDEDEYDEESVYQGRLSECESFIRLTIGGYL